MGGHQGIVIQRHVTSAERIQPYSEYDSFYSASHYLYPDRYIYEPHGPHPQPERSYYLPNAPAIQSLSATFNPESPECPADQRAKHIQLYAPQSKPGTVVEL